jgi:hypothetical protein
VTSRCGRGRGTKETKAIRCGVCYYSIVLNAHRVTSKADTDIDAVRKQKVNVYLPSLRMKIPDHVYVLGHSYTCHALIKYNRIRVKMIRIAAIRVTCI